MKTIEEFHKEVLADSNLKAQCAEAIRGGKLDEFLKAQSCAATADEVKAFLDSKTESSKEVSFDELDSTAGGCDDEFWLSLGTAGIGCGIAAAMSAADKDYKLSDNAVLC